MVWTESVSSYRAPLLQPALQRLLEQFPDLQSKKGPVFIKVNIVRPARPRSAVITHPMLVAGLIAELRTRGWREITIGEGPAVGVDVPAAFRVSGYARLARELKVSLVDLHGAERRPVPWQYGTLELPRLLLESDLYINVAKLKTHVHTTVSLGIKNQQGLLTPEAKKDNHRNWGLHGPLAALAAAVRPDLTIVDGILALEGQGPTQGRPRRSGVLVAGNDLPATDLVCCRLMGIDPQAVAHLRLALEQMGEPFPPALPLAADHAAIPPFILPELGPKRILRFTSWKNPRSCAAGDHAFEQALGWALRHPWLWPRLASTGLRLLLREGLDVVRGHQAPLPPDVRHLLCLGDCTADLARQHGAAHVPGCPPRPEHILQALLKL